MNSYYYCILLLLPLIFAYPNPPTNDHDRFLDMYVKERLANTDSMHHGSLNNEHVVRRQNMYPFPLMQQQLPQFQQMCLPHIWTCGPGLPPCCSGLMCYDGNAKRGRYCVARG
ncbi:hypothetical protein I4U23_009292 [Adineta vaga]|nr:hypothetical protein I4U23_009292 [Adineta vaga]